MHPTNQPTGTVVTWPWWSLPSPCLSGHTTTTGGGELVVRWWQPGDEEPPPDMAVPARPRR